MAIRRTETTEEYSATEVSRLQRKLNCTKSLFLLCLPFCHPLNRKGRKCFPVSPHWIPRHSLIYSNLSISPHDLTSWTETHSAKRPQEFNTLRQQFLWIWPETLRFIFPRFMHSPYHEGLIISGRQATPGILRATTFFMPIQAHAGHAV